MDAVPGNRLTQGLGWRGHWRDMLGGSAEKVNCDWVDTPSAAFLYSLHARMPAPGGSNAEASRDGFPDCSLPNFRLCARTRSSSTAAADCCQPGELPRGLGSRNWRYVCRHHGRRRDLESRCSAGCREPAIPRCARRQRQSRLFDVHWKQHDRFSHLQNRRRRRELDDTVHE